MYRHIHIQILAEKAAQCAMAIEEGLCRRTYHKEQVYNMQIHIDSLTAEAKRLGDKVFDLEHHTREMEEYKQSELDVRIYIVKSNF